MSRTIHQTEIATALASLKEGLAAANAAFSQVESYYATSAEVDLDDHRQSGLEVLSGLLERLDALARTLRQDCLPPVEQLWMATEAVRQAVHQQQANQSTRSERYEREQVRREQEDAAEEARAQELEEQRQVNRLLRGDEPVDDPGEPKEEAGK